MSHQPVFRAILLLAVFGAASAHGGDATLASFENLRITAIELLGRKVTREYVITREVKTRVGEPLRVALIEEDLKRLDNLSIFAEVRVEASADGAGVRLAFRFKETPSSVPLLGASYNEQDGRRTLHRLPENLGRGIVGVFGRDTLMPLVVGGVATGGALVLDEDMRDRINPDPGEGWGQTLQTAGGPVWSSVFVATVFGAGRMSKNARFRAASYDALDAAIMNVVYFQGIKLVAKRPRPNRSNNGSFPSGHTSSAFALATVVERHYGWKFGGPAYLLAAVVGASRMKQDTHYFSDVVAGATLGYLVGKTVVRVNNSPLVSGSDKRSSLNLAPIVSRRTRGLQVSFTF